MVTVPVNSSFGEILSYGADFGPGLRHVARGRGLPEAERPGECGNGQSRGSARGGCPPRAQHAIPAGMCPEPVIPYIPYLLAYPSGSSPALSRRRKNTGVNLK